MKELSLCFACILFSVVSFAQKFTMANTQMNIVYVGVENPISVTVEGHEASSYTLSCGEAEIKRGEGKSDYIFIPKRAGEIAVKIMTKNGGGEKEIGSYGFRARALPSPLAQIAGKSGGYVPLQVFQAQVGVIAVVKGFDFDVHCIIDKFEFSVKRGSTEIFNHKNIGGRFDSYITAFLPKLHEGDIISVTEISGLANNRIKQELDNITLYLQ